MRSGIADARGSVTRGGVPAQTRSAGLLPAQRSAGPDRDPTASILVAEPEIGAAGPLAERLTALGAGTATAVGTVDDATALADSGTVGDLAIVSLRFGARALDLIMLLRSRGWRRVLTWASASDTGLALDALRAGATGILVSQRRPGVTTLLPASVFDLSDREIEVIGMVADGRSNKWIGRQLNLSALTVKSHLARIGRKLGTGDRAHIVTLALRAGIIS